MLYIYIALIIGLTLEVLILLFMIASTSRYDPFKPLGYIGVVVAILTIVILIWTGAASNWFVETTVTTPEQWSNPFEAQLTCTQTPAPAPCRVP
jgi:hypothetical protein